MSNCKVIALTNHDIVNIKRSKGTEKGWKRECICRYNQSSYAVAGCNEDSVKKGVYISVLLLKGKKRAG